MAKRRVQGRDDDTKTQVFEGRDVQALAQLLKAGSIREPRVRFSTVLGLSRDFMVGWAVVAAFIAQPSVTRRGAERFVAKESKALAGFGAEQAEYLRGLYAGLSAAVPR